MSEMKSLDIPVKLLNGDKTISLGSAEISVFRYRKSKNTNDISLVPHIKYGERAILLTADIDPTAQRKMAVEYGENVPLYFTSRQPLVMLTDGSRWQVQQWSACSIMLPWFSHIPDVNE